MSLGSTGCFWAPSLFAIWCFEQAEPCFASCWLAARPILQLEAEAGSPEKPFEVSSGLTAIPPGLLPGDPTASGVDKHLQKSAAIFPENMQPGWARWKPLHAVLGARRIGADGSLQTDMGFGVQRGTRRPRVSSSAPP